MFHIQTKYTIFVTNYGKEYSCIKKMELKATFTPKSKLKPTNDNKRYE